MRGTTIPSGMNHKPARSQAVEPVASLHLVMNLDQILEAAEAGGEDLARLGNVQRSFGGFVLTICSDRSPDESLELLSLAHAQWPHHLLTDGGRTIHHLTRQGGMEPDQDYDEWLDSQGAARPHERGVAAAAMEYLEICWNTPRPLMVLGDLDRDYPLMGLADLPVLESGSDENSPWRAQLLARSFRARHRGLRDVIHLSLACLAPQGKDRHSWRIESHRAQGGNMRGRGH